MNFMNTPLLALARARLGGAQADIDALATLVDQNASPVLSPN
jgi:hypothetical protein